MHRPCFYVLADYGFGYDSTAGRTLCAYPRYHDVPHYVRVHGKRISSKIYRKLFLEVFGGSAAHSIRHMWQEARRLKNIK